MNDYPKILYADGNVEGLTAIVFDIEEEKVIRATGFKSLNEPKKKIPPVIKEVEVAAKEEYEAVADPARTPFKSMMDKVTKVFS
jgi:hypothetical protein